MNYLYMSLEKINRIKSNIEKKNSKEYTRLKLKNKLNFKMMV